MSDQPWKTVANEVRLDTWRDALIAAKGNITHAAKAIGISYEYAKILNRRYDLKEFAAKLRLEAGAVRTTAGERKGVVSGRPRKA